MIAIRDVTKIYPGKVPVPALRGVSADIEGGQFVAIMGRSGSGKSTLLHVLGLIDVPTDGRVSIDGVDAICLSDRDKARFRLQHLGYVFQEYSLVAELTALENVCLPAFALGGMQNGYKRQARELLEAVGLGKRLHHYPHELSGGEQQRVAVARALVNRPKILLADEPTANLDSTSASIVLDLLRQVNRERGQTIVMVTHEAEDQKYVDLVIWLKDGLIEKLDERTRVH